MLYTLRCRNCDQEVKADSLPLLVGGYLLHTVHSHWKELQAFHDASPETVQEAIAMAEARGWI